MKLLLVGLNHRTAPVMLREQVACPLRDLPGALDTLRTQFGMTEAVFLSTCNRVECYAAVEPSASPQILEFFTRQSRLPGDAIRPHLYQLDGRLAVRHLFRVAAGLDSMILGESEITAQVKHAYAAAQAKGMTGPVFNRLFQKALHSTKVVRSSTAIANGHASIGSAVSALVARDFPGGLQDREVLLWGAGKAAESTVKYLMKQGAGQLWVVNRTQTKAQSLASLCQGGWLSWERALAHLARVDVAIVCTQAPHYVIDRSDVDTAMASRPGRPLVLVDLSVPRNIDPAVADRPGVRLYNIDDLQAVAQAAMDHRTQEAARCEPFIDRQVAHFVHWWQTLSSQEVVPC